MTGWLTRLASRMEARRRRDFVTVPLKRLSWRPEDCEASLDRVFDHVRADADRAIDWYCKSRRLKGRVAYLCRHLAVLIVGAVALLPLLAQLGRVQRPPAWIGVLTESSLFEPVWVSIALALAAGALAYDRALGASSGWIRYIRTELKLRDAVEAFQLDWESRRARWQGARPTGEQVDAMLQSARAFSAQVNAIVQEETNAWVEEFQSSMRQLDEAVRARAAAEEDREKARADARAEQARASEPGAVNLTVLNGDRCADGWSVTVDDAGEARFAGTTAALAGILPGIRVFKVSGTIDGADREVSVAIKVAAGEITPGQVSL